MEMKLQHYSHTHPLFFTKDQSTKEGKQIPCSGCEKPIPGPSYNCGKCKFFLHDICANLPLKISHPIHREHPLVLLSNPPVQYSECVCDFCNRTCNSFVYHCFTCRFDLDIPCALLPPRVTGGFLELEHFSHEHQLVLVEDHSKDVCCFACKQMVSSGPGYSCSLCEFFLHMKCSKLPPLIDHPYHRQHSLILLTNPPLYYASCICDFCHETCQGFVYHCPFCKFDLDIKCAMLPLCIIEPENHSHRFIHLMKPLSFVCDACGEKGDHNPYLCTLCQIIVHQDCRFLPHTMEIISHAHPVTQFYFLQGSNSSYFCSICCYELNPNYGGYACFCCNFFAHLNCTIANSVSLEASDLKTGTQAGDIILRGDFFNSVTDIIKEINLEGDLTAMVAKHFSHPHELTLNEREVNNGKLCDCCIKPITEPFYSCPKSDLFFHKTCLELPRKKQHPFHPHPLTLLPKNPNFEGLFFCDACHQSCHGFTYNCEQCDFNLDIRCGSLSKILKHEAHEHPLVFSKGNGYTDCCGCGYPNEIFYSCNDCSFVLDFSCATLPNSARHKHHEHTLDLTYTGEADQTYCDICEEDRNPKHWFYCCKICKFSAHPKCALGKYPYIKLGKTYPYDAHPHPLVFVYKTRSHPPCSKSGNPCKGLALECIKPDCNFIIEWCHVEILHF